MTQRFIENVSRDDVRKGWHFDAGSNSMLIQIVDPASGFPEPKHNFKEVHQFEFLDAEATDGFPDECKCTDVDAQRLVKLLQRALDEHMNVVVHCHAGLCRSGAVVEVAVMMGFVNPERLRIPNLLVKHKMMKVLGWTYDPDEKQEAVNGVTHSSGIVLPANGEW